MTDALRIHQNHLLFLQDHSCSFRFDDSADDAPYMLDLVLDGRKMFPVYLHLQAEQSSPVAEENELRNAMDQIVSKFKYDFWQEGLDPIDSLNSMRTTAYKTSLAEALLRLLSHDIFSYDVWQSILLNCREIYTLTYKNETLLVMADDQNLTCCLFFDALTNRVTGYSIDPVTISNLLNQSEMERPT